jgi:hypothetical protein
MNRDGGVLIKEYSAQACRNARHQHRFSTKGISMRGPKRTPGERERDLEQLAVHYCRGLSQRAMAEKLGVSRQQIGYDLKILQKRWQESALAHLDAKKAQELARLDHLEAVAWSAWERSCQDAETITSSTVKGRVSKEGATLPDLQKVSTMTKHQAGDPRFLEHVYRCIDKRCEVLGLNAPKKVAPTSPDGTQAYAEALTDEERLAGYDAILARVATLRLGHDDQGGSNAGGQALDGPHGDLSSGQPET